MMMLGPLLLLAVLIFHRTVAEGSSGCPLFPSPNERFGFGALGGITHYDAAQLHAGWYVNWGTTSNLSHHGGLEFVHIIRVGAHNQPNPLSIASVVESNPGATWLIGNEMDTTYDWQDGRTPQEYAELYHDWYTFLKTRDPTCKVAIGGVVQPTPLRLQYLDMILAHYQNLYGQKMPVDVWNVHNFILREQKDSWGCGIPPGLDATQGELREVQDHDRMDLFQQQIVAFRQWMKDRGERDKPLIVSEYGILLSTYWGFIDERVKAFMTNTFDYFSTAADDSLGYAADGHRLVQRWAWYSLNDANFEGYNVRSNLFDPGSKAIRPLGVAFANYTAPLVQPYVDLVPGAVSINSSEGPYYGEPATFNLQAIVFNRGNAATPQGFTVSLWEGTPGQSTLIGSSQLDGLDGGWGSATTASFPWAATVTAPRSLYVWVDSGQAVGEACEGNNQGERKIYANLWPSSISFSFDPAEPELSTGEPVTVTIKAPVNNEGHLGVKNVVVGFWNGDPHAGGTSLGSDTLPVVEAGSSGVAQVIWPNVGFGLYEIYVKADTADSIVELSESDNVIHKSLMVVETRVFLPLTLKNQPGSTVAVTPLFLSP